MDFDKLISSGHFCSLPFARQTFWTDGSYKLCCHSGGESIEPGNDNKLAFNSTQLNQIRQQFLNGEFPNICHRCKAENASGLISKNIEENQLLNNNPQDRLNLIENIKSFLDDKDILPLALDVRLSNLCNLKCRTCNPATSSSVNNEIKKLSLTQVDSKKFYRVDESYERSHQSLPIFDDKLSKIYLVGGEPLLEDLNIQLLEKIKDTSVVISINTNLTVINKRLLTAISKFDKVDIVVSIDSFGSVNDYIRNGSIFSQVIENMHAILKLDNVALSVNSVLNIINIFDIGNLVVYLNNTFHGDIRHFINLVETEKELFVRCLPLELRQEAIEHLNYTKTQTTHHWTINNLNNIIKILEEQPWDSNNFNKFINITKILDQARGERLIDVVPQFTKYYND